MEKNIPIIELSPMEFSPIPMPNLTLSPMNLKKIATPPILITKIPLPDIKPAPYNLGLKEHPNIRFEYGNGIWNTKDDILEGAAYLSELVDRFNVHGVYNITRGREEDFWRVLRQRWTDGESNRSKKIRKEWGKYFANSSKDSQIVRVCMSEGTMHTLQALHHVPPEIRKRIHVIAVAPAECIPEALCGSIRHLYCRNDRVPKIWALRDAKKMNQMHTFEEVEIEESDKKWHHEFMDPIYKEPLSRTLKEIIKRVCPN